MEEIIRLRAQNDTLIKALEPLVQLAMAFNRTIQPPDHKIYNLSFTAKQIRAAQAALQATQET